MKEKCLEKEARKDLIIRKIARRFFNEGFRAGKYFKGGEEGIRYMNFMFDFAWDKLKKDKVLERWKK